MKLRGYPDGTLLVFGAWEADPVPRGCIGEVSPVDRR
jgi:hypothetical protein